MKKWPDPQAGNWFERLDADGVWTPVDPGDLAEGDHVRICWGNGVSDSWIFHEAELESV